MPKSNLFLLVYLCSSLIFINCSGFGILTEDKTNKRSFSPTMNLINTPTNPSNDTELNVTVSGDNIVEYQYKIVTQDDVCTDGGYNGTWISISTPITNVIEDEGDYKLCIIGRDADSNTQTEETATIYTWTKGEYWELQIKTTDINQNMTIDYVNANNLLIKWGDGTEVVENGTGDATHKYTDAGTYTLKIKGQANRILFNNQHGQERLTRILTPVRGIKGISSFASTFENCTNLTGSIPKGLFDTCPDVTSFKDTFSGCSELTGSIPQDLFAYNDHVTTFQGTFAYCSKLSGSIPAGLFDNKSAVTSFFKTFEFCSELTGPIPGDLFAHTDKVTSFQSTFSECSKLTGPIPAGLFDNCPEVTTFMDTFLSCSELTGPIPSELFSYNEKVTSFQSTFSNCSKLSGPIPAELFDKNTQVTTLKGTFENCVSITGPAPLFWENTTTKFPSLTLWENCFKEVISASNYDTIPGDWK